MCADKIKQPKRTTVLKMAEATTKTIKALRNPSFNSENIKSFNIFKT